MKKFLISLILIIILLLVIFFLWIFLSNKLPLMGKSFDDVVWKNNPYERCGMTNNVKKILRKQKFSETEVLEMLGPYDTEITGLDNSVYFLGICQASEGNLLHLLFDGQKQLVDIKDLINSKDFYRRQLLFIKQRNEESVGDSLYNLDFYLVQKDLITGSYYAEKNKLMHYVAGCGGNSGLFVLFKDPNNLFGEIKLMIRTLISEKLKIKLKKKSIGSYIYNVGCVHKIQEQDLNKDGNNELIVYSRSGGTGISDNLMNIINYFDEEVNDIEIRLKGHDTSCAHFVFPSSKKEEIFNRLKLDYCSNYYLNAYSAEMKTNSGEIDIVTTRRISFDNSILLDEFIKLNPSYLNGECSYKFGKIILDDEIKLIQYADECKILN